MPAKIIKHKWFLVCLVLAVFLAFFRNTQGTWQQDNYVGYAEHLPSDIGQISFFDSRLLPGLPILIYILHYLAGDFYVAGYLITFLSFIGSYLLLYKLTKSNLSFLPLVFPPILLNLASLIDTEYPFIFLLILGYSLIKGRRYNLAFLVIGISVWFRLAGVAVMAGVFVYMLLKKEFRKVFAGLSYFLMPVLLLSLYNIHFFGYENPFYQLFAYQALHPERISFGAIQLVQDLIRAIRWGWYKIFISGFFYVIFYVLMYIKTFKTKGLEFWIITGLYLFTLSVNLVPFLENLGRYLAPAVPFFWLVHYNKLQRSALAVAAIIASFLVVIV